MVSAVFATIGKIERSVRFGVSLVGVPCIAMMVSLISECIYLGLQSTVYQSTVYESHSESISLLGYRSHDIVTLRGKRTSNENDFNIPTSSNLDCLQLIVLGSHCLILWYEPSRLNLRKGHTAS